MTNAELAAFLEANATQFLLAFLRDPGVASLRVDASGLIVVGELRVGDADHARLTTDVALRAGMGEALSVLSKHVSGRPARVQPIRAGLTGGAFAALSGRVAPPASGTSGLSALSTRPRAVVKRGWRT